jgi:hypothetical protein
MRDFEGARVAIVTDPRLAARRHWVNDGDGATQGQASTSVIQFPHVALSPLASIPLSATRHRSICIRSWPLRVSAAGLTESKNG